MYNITFETIYTKLFAEELDILERTAALAVEDAAQAVAEAKVKTAEAVTAALKADLLSRSARVAVNAWRGGIAEYSKTIHV